MQIFILGNGNFPNLAEESGKSSIRIFQTAYSVSENSQVQSGYRRQILHTFVILCGKCEKKNLIQKGNFDK